MTRTWILVADASRARLFELEQGRGRRREGWELLRTFEHPESREQGQDLFPNRGAQIQHTGEKTTRGALEPLSLHQLEAERFARELIAALDPPLSQGRYDELVLIAPPAFMGALRRHLTPPMERRLKATLTKDYARLEAAEIERSVSL